MQSFPDESADSQYGATRDVTSVNWLPFLDSTGSTNDDLLAHSAQLPDYTVEVAGAQTAGHGRNGRTWVSAGLAVSILLPRPVHATWAALIGALAVRRVLVANDVNAALKWPNDVLAITAPAVGAEQPGISQPLTESKVAGVLGQITVDGRIVLGLGINIAPAGQPGSGAGAPMVPLDLDGLDPEVAVRPIPATSVRRWDTNQNIARELVNEVLDLWHTTELDSLVAEFTASCITLGREVSVYPIAGDPWLGKAVGITASGGLQVATAGGTREITAGDIRHIRWGDK